MRNKSPGFTMIELLMVIVIIAFLAVLVAPAVTTSLSASRLTQATDQVTNLLSFSRQTAISCNHTVEVRFYQYGDPSIPGQNANNPLTGQYCSMQVFLFNDSGNAVALDSIERLPTGIVVDSGTLSSILGTSQAKTFSPPSTLDPKVSLPRCGTNYNTAAFQFRPDGSTNLLIGSLWFVTLHASTNGDKLTALPSNFSTIQIDPISGSLVSYRP